MFIRKITRHEPGDPFSPATLLLENESSILIDSSNIRELKYFGKKESSSDY